jgi:hypothetical protein
MSSLSHSAFIAIIQEQLELAAIIDLFFNVKKPHDFILLALPLVS